MTRATSIRTAAASLALATCAVPLAGIAAPQENPMVGMSGVERAYVARGRSLSAMDVTSNLARYTGAHVAFVCEVTSVVDARQMIGQCGKEIEPVDMYVHMDTRTIRVGERLRVVGEMEPPSQWVDVTGHSWYTPFVHARYVDRLR